MLGKKNVLLLSIAVFALLAGLVLAAPTNVSVTNNVTSMTTSDTSQFNVTVMNAASDTLGNISNISISYVFISTTVQANLNAHCGKLYANVTSTTGTLLCSNSSSWNLNSSVPPETMNITFKLAAPSAPNTTDNQYGINVTSCNFTATNAANSDCTSTWFGIAVTDNDNPVVYFSTPKNLSNLLSLSSTSDGVSMTSAVSFGYTVSDNSGAYSNCSLHTNASGSGTFNVYASNSSAITEAGLNWINTTLADGEYKWNIKCFDAAGNNAFNSTNYTLKVETSLPTSVISYFGTNNTDLFYSNCTGNSIINILVNTTGVGNLTMNVTIDNTTDSNAAGMLFASGLKTLTMNYSASNGYYNASFRITNTPTNFGGVPLTITYTDGLYTNVNVTSAGTSPVAYGLTTPSTLGGSTTNFCYLTNFSGIANLTFEKIGYGMIIFNSTVNMSTKEQGEKFAGLSTAMYIDNKSIWLNSTYFDQLNKNATIIMSAMPWVSMPNLTYAAEGSTDVNACPDTICKGMRWTNNTSVGTFGTLVFNVTHFTNYSADGDAPTITASSPSGTQTSGTVIIAATTNEKAVCKYDTTYNASYWALANTFTTTNSTSHQQTLSLSNGAYVYYVLCQDMANNNMTATTNISFSVSITAASNPGGGGGSSSGTGIPTESQAVSGIQPGVTSTVTLSSTQIAITSFDITAAQLIINGQLTVSQWTVLPEGVTVAAGDKVYRYLKVDKFGIADSAIKSAKVRFKVPRTWLNENGVSNPTDITLSRYGDGKWTDLTTRQTNEDTNSYYFESDSPGLSVFAVKFKPGAALPLSSTGNETEVSVNATTEAEKAAAKQASDTMMTGVVILGLLAVAAGGIWYYLSKEKEFGRLPWRRKVGFKSPQK